MIKPEELKDKKMIKIIDNQIQDKEAIFVEVKGLPYFYGERDNPKDLPTGLVSEITNVHYCYRAIHSFIKKNDFLKNKKITRSYVNYFSPKENANFHIDDYSGYTLLYYPNLEYDLNEGGETKFLSENNTLVSVLPIPGRIAVFDASISHSASSFKTQPRFTVVFKFKE